MTDIDTELHPVTEGPVIILVEPQLGENIGMVARAMANFGLSELRLVNSARRLAEREGDAPRRAAPTMSSTTPWSSTICARRSPISISSCHHGARARRLQAGARAGRGGRALRSRAAAEAHRHPVRARALRPRQRGDRLADEIVTFPVNPAFASLNIAQAVLLMSYEWMKSGLARETDTAFPGPEIDAGAEGASARPVRSSRRGARRARLFPAAAEEAENGRQSARRADPAGLQRGEIKVLRGVVASLDYFSPKEPRGAGYPERKAEADRAWRIRGRPRRAPAKDGEAERWLSGRS